jgi:serine/threonine protein phosphatase PrpC
VRIAPTTVPVPLAPGTVFLVCSDGVTDMLTEEDLEGCLRGEDTDVVQAICDAVLEAGARDNLTVMLVRIAGGLAGE